MAIGCFAFKLRWIEENILKRLPQLSGCMGFACVSDLLFLHGSLQYQQASKFKHCAATHIIRIENGTNILGDTVVYIKRENSGR